MRLKWKIKSNKNINNVNDNVNKTKIIFGFLFY